MGEHELLLVVLEPDMRAQEMIELIEAIRRMKGVTVVRTMDGVIQNAISDASPLRSEGN